MVTYTTPKAIQIGCTHKHNGNFPASPQPPRPAVHAPAGLLGGDKIQYGVNEFKIGGLPFWCGTICASVALCARAPHITYYTYKRSPLPFVRVCICALSPLRSNLDQLDR